MMTRLICWGLAALTSLLVPGSNQTLRSEEPEVRQLGKPLLRVWFPTTLLRDHQEFLKEIHQEINADESGQQQPSDPIPKSTDQPPVRHEGLLVYFDPIGEGNPNVSRSYFAGRRWLNPIRFMAVADRVEFEKIVRERTYMDQDTQFGVLKDRDGAFEYIASIQWLMADTSIIQSYLQHVSRYWRYRDGYMFFGDDEALLTMELPDVQDLKLRGRPSERDLFAQLDFDALSPRKKGRFWAAISKRLERVLQQHDEEDTINYAFRKAWGELQLQLIQAVTNDLQSIRLGVDFASTEKPAQINLDLIARPGADLEKYVGKSSVGTRQMTSVIEQPSILTLSAGWELPEQFEEVLKRSIAVLNKELVTHAGFNPDVFLATDELTTALQESLGASREFVIKLSRSEQGYTLYGGIRLSEADRVSKSLETLLNSLTSTTGTGVMRTRDPFGRSYLSYRPSHLSEFVAQSNREQFPSEAHLTVDGSTLWYSFGPPDALEVLSKSLEESDNLARKSRRSRIPALLLDLELDRCLADEETATGFDKVPQLALQSLNEKLPRSNRGNWSFNNITVYTSPGSTVTGSGQSDALIQGSTVTGTVNRGLTYLQKSQAESNDNPGITFSPDTAYTLTATDQTIRLWELDNPSLDLNKFLKPDQSRIRAEFETDPNRLRLKLTVGLGVIRHVFGQLSQQSSPMTGVIHINDGTESNLQFDLQVAPLPDVSKP